MLGSANRPVAIDGRFVGTAMISGSYTVVVGGIVAYLLEGG